VGHTSPGATGTPRPVAPGEMSPARRVPDGRSDRPEHRHDQLNVDRLHGGECQAAPLIAAIDSTPFPALVSAFPRTPERCWEITGSVFPMETTVDSVGRIVVPKPLRDALGLLPGTTVDVTAYGAGLQVLPTGRTARLVDIDGALVADSTTEVTDEIVFGLIDSLRR